MVDRIDCLGEAMVLSTLDCNAGYWQIHVAMEDQEKTTLTGQEGTFCYVRLPIGLTNAPGTFQRALDLLLAGVNLKTCLFNVDDIIVISDSSDEHIHKLREVLRLLAQSVMSLKDSKCHPFKKEVDAWANSWARGTCGSSRRTSSACDRRDRQG